MAAPSFFSLLCLYLIQLFSVPEATASNDGLSFDLIHRDSPKSPFHNPLSTNFDRLHNAIRRSTLRSTYLNQISLADTQSQIIPNGGEYLMKFSIGTPPVEVLNIVDTGSDISWLQCKPCTRCYKQITPIFDPKKSSTYQNLPYQSKQCLNTRGSSCKNSTCQYLVSYVDTSYTRGDLALEKFIFSSDSRQRTSFPNVVFGCGHDNVGTINDTGSGVIGLGTGPLSLIGQLKSFSGKFSYCLVPPNSEKTSKINFGSNAIVLGTGVVSTPYFTSTPDTFYYLTFEGITVGKINLPYKNSKFGPSVVKYNTSIDSGTQLTFIPASKHNIIIDSGTQFTFIPVSTYQGLESTLVKAINGTRVKDPTGISNLCYSIAQGGIDVPTIAFHFSGGADLELSKYSTFVETYKGVVCLSILPTSGLGVFGNLSQMDFLVGYDTVKMVVSFKPTDCTKQ